MLVDATSLDEYFVEHDVEPGVVRATLGPRIRRARFERLHGLSLETFGRQIAEVMQRKRAFSNVTISNWETGRQEPSFEALVAIARLTRLPLRYFAGVGELEDYPRIDWLAPERSDDVGNLEDLIQRARRLPQHAGRLIEAQINSLVDDLYRLDGKDPVGSLVARR
jgi:transcriptional regulator with XRE-family HTH domain